MKKMAEAWSVVVRQKAVNERSLQAGQFRKLWFGNESKFALVTNVVKQDLRKNGGEMKLNPAIVATGIATVEQLRDLIKSDAMYRNPAVYNLICGGLESGKIKKLTKPEGPTSIKRLLTGAHEANLRLELYYALEKQSLDTLHRMIIQAIEQNFGGLLVSWYGMIVVITKKLLR